MLMTSTFTRTLRLKVRSEAYGWLSVAAVEVNQVFNFCNETALLAATRTDLKRKWLTGFDLCHLTSGASRYFDRTQRHLDGAAGATHDCPGPGTPPTSV